jgi:hypothetical protein
MIRAAFVLALGVLAAACSDAETTNAATGTGEADLQVGLSPDFEVDPLWPKPLPNHWVLGSTIGVSVDDQDHVWILHRPGSVDDNFKAAAVTPQVGRCCTPAPPVLEFDQDGNLLRHWGGPGEGYEWPTSNHGLTVDHKGNVWIGGNDEKQDTHVLKFTRDGKFLLQIGRQGIHNGSNDPEHLWRPAKIFIEPMANEAYIADGYGNRRIVVFDADTGKYKRHWGAYGARPDDADIGNYDPAAPPAKQFRTVHCVIVSTDQFVYVCDRVNDRVQVFRTDGTFVKEAFFETKTIRSGSVWDMTFSHDPQQTYIYQVDGVNEEVRVLRRDSLEVVTTFGDGGRQPGQFYGVHNVAVDSKGNLYTTETYNGARLQRFLNKGVRSVPKNRGVPWPGQ